MSTQPPPPPRFIGDDAGAIANLLPGTAPSFENIDLVGAGETSAAFDVERLLSGSALYAAGAANAAFPSASPTRALDRDHILSFCTTHVEVDGEAVPPWAPLSGVFATRGGRHLQVHCNFPHHAQGVVRVLGCKPERDALAAAIAERDAFELEGELIDAGMVAAALRTLEEWDRHPHAMATAGLPLIDVTRIGDTPPTTAARTGGPIRVLDTTRVLAGPVAGQLLAGHALDVLRVGAAHLPSVDVGVIATGPGKRNAHVDLRQESGRAEMSTLLSGADIWIDAYRPGAMATHGFTAERAADLRPGIVVVQISAFDWVGPWAGRRGFDSIVQSTSGIRWAGGVFADTDDDAPRGLPVQALDYATGFLAAGVAAQLVAHQRQVGGSWLARLSLLRTRNHLVSMGGPRAYAPSPMVAARRYLHEVDSDFGRLTLVRPFTGSLGSAPRRLGSSRARWR